MILSSAPTPVESRPSYRWARDNYPHLSRLATFTFALRALSTLEAWTKALDRNHGASAIYALLFGALLISATQLLIAGWTGLGDGVLLFALVENFT